MAEARVFKFYAQLHHTNCRCLWITNYPKWACQGHTTYFEILVCLGSGSRDLFIFWQITDNVLDMLQDVQLQRSKGDENSQFNAKKAKT